MEFFLISLLNGVSYGLLLFMLSSGLTLIFSTLVVGIAGHADDMKAMGRIALKAIIYFEIVTTLALFVGLGAVNLVKPGEGLTIPKNADVLKDLPQTKVTFEGVIAHLTPQSFFEAAAKIR